MQLLKYTAIVILFLSSASTVNSYKLYENAKNRADAVIYTTSTAPVGAGTELWDSSAKEWVLAENESYKNYLGWLYVYDDMLKEAPALMSWAASLKAQYKYCVVLGMGGSSLSVEAMRVLFGHIKGYPELIVLDTSNPDKFADVQKHIDLSKTLFIVSSKSGTTAETIYGYKFFFSQLQGISNNPAGHFIAITDEGSFLDKEGKDKQFLRVFLNRKDIGGRFSALSYFGMVPAAVAGYDIEQILSSAAKYAEYLKTNPSLPVALAKAMTPSQEYGYTRLFLSLDKKLAGFGLWIEQLASESLGKEAKGVLPLIINKPKKGLIKQSDIFVSIGKQCGKIKHIGGADFALCFNNKTDIGKQFLLWELAAACTGVNMGINPFDQPDVELAKKLTNKMIKESDDILTSPLNFSGQIENAYNTSRDIASVLKEEGKNSAYITLLIYSNLNNKEEQSVRKFAAKLQKATNTPVVITYGPRYLHSLGQLHKGGPNNGLFFIITDIKSDIVLGGGESMKKLILAQAYGDFLALSEKQRNVIKVNLDGKISVGQYFKDLEKLIK